MFKFEQSAKISCLENKLAIRSAILAPDNTLVGRGPTFQGGRVANLLIAYVTYTAYYS